MTNESHTHSNCRLHHRIWQPVVFVKNPPHWDMVFSLFHADEFNFVSLKISVVICCSLSSSLPPPSSSQLYWVAKQHVVQTKVVFLRCCQVSQFNSSLPRLRGSILVASWPTLSPTASATHTAISRILVFFHVCHSEQMACCHCPCFCWWQLLSLTPWALLLVAWSIWE